jgi:predicted glycosyltransferase
VLGIPSVTIGDYEFAKLFAIVRPDWLIVPQVIPDDAVKGFKSRVLKYPGIKEEVYAPRFKPQGNIMQQLGLNDENLIVTIRPPATEAHYHVHESEELFDEVLDYLGDRTDVKIVLLPRNQRQADAIRASRPELFRSKKMIIPEVVDGMSLIWHSDLVISGGGTMNREAAALGVPVYSIFRGKIGAVDRHLAANGRLTLIESREDVRRKLVLRHRHRRMEPTRTTSPTLEKVVEHIVSIVDGAR